jgi:hypothetical protein
MDKKVLKKATEDTPEPCSGWMFKAVANMTKSSPKACEDVVNWLCSKLENSKSPNVKKKCLNIIRSVASYGDTEFARLIVRHSEEIKKYASTHSICIMYSIVVMFLLLITIILFCC